MKILNNTTIVLIVLIFTACDVDRNERGYSYFPDMENSRAYETYSENPVFSNHHTMLSPVENTIPRGSIPFHFEKTDEDRVMAGLELKNPYLTGEIDTMAIKEGGRLFSIFCIHCHGEKGNGKGHLYTSGKYPFQPADLTSDKIKKLPDGEIFHVISVGFGVMGAHQGQIMPDERWKIISYVRTNLMNPKVMVQKTDSIKSEQVIP